MATWTVTAYPPQSTTGTVIVPTRVDFEAELQDPSTFNFMVEYDWDSFYSESTVTNPLQLNSYVTLTRDGVYVFRGFIHQRPLEMAENGERFIHCYCLDPMAKTKGTQATYTADGTTHYVWQRITPSIAISQEAILPLTQIGDSVYPYMINAAHLGDTPSAYLPVSVTNDTAVGTGDWTDVATELKATTGHEGMLPAGIIQCESEWIQYDGYIQDDSGVYWFHNCTRGVLGTSAAAHAATTAVDQIISKKVHPDAPVLVEVNNGSAWEIVASTQYEVQVEEGRIDLVADPDAIASTGTSSGLRVTCHFFDETNTYANGTLWLSDVLPAIYTEANTVGGAGLAAGQLDITDDTDGTGIDPDIALAFVIVDEPKNTNALVDDILNDTGLINNLNPSNNSLAKYWDHANNKLCIRSLRQDAAGSEDVVFTSFRDSWQDVALDDIYSAVLVKYEAGLNFNLCGPGRFWHHEVGDTDASAAAVAINFWLKLDAASTGEVTWVDQNTTGHNRVGNLLTDGRVDTGWGLSWSSPSNPADGVTCLYAYFPDTDGDGNPETFTVTEITATFDLTYTSSGTANPVHVKILGIEEYDATTDPPGLGADDPVNISGDLEIRFPGGLTGNTSGQTSVTMQATGLAKNLQAIVIMADGLPQSQDADREIRVRELLVKGVLNKTKFVKITNQSHDDSATLDATNIYAPLSYAKLIGSNPSGAELDQHRVLILDIGPASDFTALSLGRLALLASLKQVDIRTFTFDAEISSVPTLGSTVTVVKGNPAGTNFTGVVIGVKYVQQGGAEMLTLRLINYNSDILGS